MKGFFKKIAMFMALAIVLGIAAPAGGASAADSWTFSKDKKILYLNENNSSGTKKVYDFNFAKGVLPSNWKTTLNFAWSSSDPTVAKVEKGGVVTGLSVGKTTISCTVTNKSNNKVVGVATAAVEVKENASRIVIVDKNKKELANGTEIGIGKDVIDLDRLMYNAAGKSTSTRGQLVTDYTKWTSSDTSVATVDANGKVTTLKEGTVTITAYTYQSKDYPDRRVMDTVTLNVVSGKTAYEFSAQQLSVNKVQLNFNSDISKVFNSASVSMSVMIGNTPIKVDVQNFAIDEKDGKKATITTYLEFFEGYEYTIKVGDETASFKATKGNPVLAVPYLFADGKDQGNVAYIDKEYGIRYKLYNEFGVDISNADGSAPVTWNDPELDYANISDNFLLVMEAGKTMLFTGALDTGADDENGNDITTTVTFAVVSRDADEVVVNNVTNWSIVDAEDLSGLSYEDYAEKLYSDSKNYPQMHKVAADDGYKYLVVRVGKSDNTMLSMDSVTFTSSNDEILTIDESSGYMYANSAGTAVVIVYYNYYDENGNFISRPVDTIRLTVSPARTLADISSDKASAILSTSGSIEDAADITITAKDSLGDFYPNQLITVNSGTTFTDSKGNVKNASVFLNNAALTTDAKGKATFTVSPSNDDIAAMMGNSSSKAVTYTFTSGNLSRKVVVTFKNASGTVTYKVEIGGTHDAGVSSETTSTPLTSIKLFSYANGVKKENITDKLAMVTGEYTSLNTLAQNFAKDGYEFFAVITKTAHVASDIDGLVSLSGEEYQFNLTASGTVSGAAISAWEVANGSNVICDKDVANVISTIESGTYLVTVYQIRHSDTAYQQTGGYYTSKLSSAGSNFTTTLSQSKAELGQILATKTDQTDIIEILKDTMTFKIGNTVISGANGNFDAYSYNVSFNVTGSKVYVRTVTIYEPVECSDGVTVHVRHTVNVGKTITLE